MKQKTAKREWITTTEAWVEFGVPRHLVYRWGPRLEAAGHAKKFDRQRGMWLVDLEAVEFLKGRRGRIGRPPKKE